ncbi:hypothetical protein SmJEL517_g06076 [Synchytrium microbalum]|uniref:Fibronectin type-III domain-containing protein n=1 Tax=Synchytrium microbalum TaxID=1806994 RepID=A0A507BYD1_9FUNG|nr:uncharacterized protein SmJEL517_g06076 [Synchytrium microbalum]TPX30345.1 hypothetical protein SmJEL517_g06076 [Synchytrium microbalum]
MIQTPIEAKEEVKRVIRPRDAFLPNINRSPSPDMTSKNNNNVSQNPDTVSSFLGQLERIRNMLKTRENEIARLRQENAMLKQVERRQRKDIEHLESQTEDAPRIINGLRNEIKLKAYFVQHTADARQLRLNSEDLSRLKSEKAKLDTLIAAEDLSTRDDLEKKLEDVIAKLGERDVELADSKKKADLLDKNLNAENRLLRARVHTLETDGAMMKDLLERTEEDGKEKDKEIANLSIYRYNMVHKKPEGPCKVCAKRERQEVEAKRRQGILETLPVLSTPTTTVTSATSVKVSATITSSIPVGEASLRVVYSQTPITSITSATPTVVLQADQTEWTAEVTELEFGRSYYFGVFASRDGVNGPIHASELVYVDAIPSTPQPPSIIPRHTTPPTMLIRILTNTEYVGTPIAKYQVYKSTQPTLQDAILLTELNVDDLVESEAGAAKVEEFDYVDCPLAIPFYFGVVAFNACGASCMSEASHVAVLDLPPAIPTQPIPKKSSPTSINLHMCTPPTGGSLANTFRIVCEALTASDQVDESSIRDLQITNITTPSACHTEIQNLDPSTNYRFQVYAKNSIGWSPASAYSNVIKLESMIPPIPTPNARVLSPTTAIVEFKTPDSVPSNVVVDGIRVYSSSSVDMDDAKLEATVAFGESECRLEFAQRGAVLWISACHVGGEVEGERTVPVFLPLPAALPIPASPPSTPSQLDDTTSTPPSAPTTTTSILSKSNYRSSYLHGSQSALDASPRGSLESIYQKNAAKSNSHNKTRKTRLDIPPPARSETTGGLNRGTMGTKLSNANLKSSSSLHGSLSSATNGKR